MQIADISNLIKEELEIRGIKQKDLAKAVGITPVAINQFLNEKQNIKLKNLLKIFDFLEKAQKLKNLFDEINTIISELGLEIELK